MDFNGVCSCIFSVFVLHPLPGTPKAHPFPNILGTSSDSAELKARDAEGGAEQQQIPTGLRSEAQGRLVGPLRQRGV